LHDAIRNGVALTPSLEDALAVQCILDAARQSSVAGARVRVERPAPVAH
jgi:hypothetical protein